MNVLSYFCLLPFFCEYLFIQIGSELTFRNCIKLKPEKKKEKKKEISSTVSVLALKSFEVIELFHIKLGNCCSLSLFQLTQCNGQAKELGSVFIKARLALRRLERAIAL